MTDSFAYLTREQLLESNPNLSYPMPPNCRYKCTHCSKAFPTTQALGGHQNAHRSEKRKQKISQKALSKSKKQAKYYCNPIKPPPNGKPKLPKAHTSELNMYFDDGAFRIGPNFRVGSYVPVESGSSCKVATSSPVHVAKFRFSKASDTGVVVGVNLPEVKIVGGEREVENNQALDLSLKL